jgi:TonB family protein
VKKEEPKPVAEKPEAKKPEPAKPETPKPVESKPAATRPEPDHPASVAPGPGAGAPGAGRVTEGGQSGDPNGGGGGAGNRSPEFYAYFAYMYESIKAQWVWAGEQDATLAATVRFSILADGSIADAQITERSRSSQYDESALNAVRATGSLTPPPASVRADFEDIELVFRAGDLMQP